MYEVSEVLASTSPLLAACPTSCLALMRCFHLTWHQRSIHYESTRVVHGSPKRGCAPQTNSRQPENSTKVSFTKLNLVYFRKEKIIQVTANAQRVNGDLNLLRLLLIASISRWL